MIRDPLASFLMRRFAAPDDDVSARRARLGLLEGYVSVVINTLLFVVKAAIGWLTGSIALLADAVHTLADSVTSGVVIVSAYVSRRPPDREHPFGHGRAELVAALVVAVLLGVAGVEFGKSALLRVLEPEVLEVPWWAAAAIAGTALVKQWLSRFAFTLARETGSRALEADAWHHKSDVLATLLVVVAMVAARFGLPWIDGVIGIAVSIIILWTAVRIARESVDPLLGEAPSRDELAEIEARAREVEGVRGVHDIIVHKYGETRVVSLHVETSEDHSPRSLHALAERVQDRVDTQGHGLVVVHVDPINTDHPHYEEMRALLDEVVRGDARLASFHDLRLVGDAEEFNVLVDVAVTQALGHETRAAISAAALERLRDRHPAAKIQLSFEPVFAYGAPSAT